MKRFFLLAGLLLVLFAGLFIWFEQSGWMTASGIERWIEVLRGSRWGIAAVTGGVLLLLLIDVVLPVPSSVVMTVSGALLGVWGGTIAAFLGATGAAMTAFWACRVGGRRTFERLVGGDDTNRIRRWFEEYGVIAVVLSRPVPMLTEILSCLGGLSRMRSSVFFAATVLGTLPVCLVYAAAGAYGTVTNPWPALLVALGIPAAGWAGLRWAKQGRLQAWGRLFRLPNLFTVPGDGLAGFLVASAVSGGVVCWMEPTLWGVLVGLVMVYMGGLALNDVLDYRTDSTERPGRPLPNGDIAPRTATRAAVGLLVGGAAVGWITGGHESGLALIAVAALAATYDAVHDTCPLRGIFLMGTCRGGAVLCGVAAASGGSFAKPLVWLPALGAFGYTALVALLARQETRRRPSLREAVLPSVLVLVLAVCAGTLLYGSGSALWPLAIFGLAVAEGGWAARRVATGADPVPSFIGRLILGMVTLQCAWCAVASAAASPPASASAALSILAALAVLRLVAEFASRRFYGS